jgi:hypothetical protein
VGDCGTSELVHISAAALPDAENPPVAATYPYRLKGNYDADGAKGNFPARDSVTIGNIQVIQPSTTQYGPEYTYDLTETKPDGLSTTWTYHIVPLSAANEAFVQAQQVLPTAPGDPGGIYILKITSNDPTSITGGLAPGGTVSFGAGLKILAFNARLGNTWNTQGNDAGSQTSYNFNGTVVQRGIVDACGHNLEDWEVHMTGNLSSPTHRNAAIDMTLGIGTEYGGFLLSYTLVETGATNGLRDFIKETATISAEPKQSGPPGP